MLRLKDPKSLIYFAFQVCEIVECKEEAEKIYATSESRIVDLCITHYNQIISQGFMS